MLNAAGLDALTLARLAGAHDAATILESALAIGYDHSGNPLEAKDVEPGASIAAIGTNVEAPVPPVATLPGLLESDPGGFLPVQARPREPRGCVEPDGLARGAIAAANQRVDGEPEPADATPDEEDGFDLTGWEAEVERPAPQDDLTLAQEAAAVQEAISNHAPIDKSEDWIDFDVFLPECATPLLRSEDAETGAELRLLLLRAIREGSVPQACVDDLCRGDDNDRDQAAESRLQLVINDLGAETDERIEYTAPSESFAVHVDPDETPDEEAIVAEALAFLDDLESHWNDPMRHYMREAQRERLITAEEEVALAKAMERGLDRALDSLSEWPAGLERLLAAAHLVRAGEKSLDWISSGSGDEAPPEVEPLDDESPDAGHHTLTDSSPIAGDGLDDDTEEVDPDLETPLSSPIDDRREAFAEPARPSEQVNDRNWAPSCHSFMFSGLARDWICKICWSSAKAHSRRGLRFKRALWNRPLVSGRNLEAGAVFGAVSLKPAP